MAVQRPRRNTPPSILFFVNPPLSSRHSRFLSLGPRTSMFQRSLHTIFTRTSHRVPPLFLSSTSLARYRIKRTRHTVTHALTYTTVHSAASRRPANGSDIAEEQRRANAPTRLNATRTATRSLRPARSHSLACLSAWNSSPPRVPRHEYPHPLGLSLLAPGRDADPLLIDVQTVIVPTSPCYLLIFVQGRIATLRT